ncbi:MAG: hypothetical protein K2O67_03600, partial [Clostridia bacterium]|nr:hypothetical protein [Clostridia bacterium]
PKDAGIYIASVDELNSIFYDKDGNVIPEGRLNYNIVCSLAVVEIYRLNVNVAIDDKTCVYGTDAANGVVYTSKVTVNGSTATVTDEVALVYDEVATLTYFRKLHEDGGAVNAIDCGEYFISASVDESFLNNYNFSFTDGTLTITKRTLNIKVSDSSAEYGDLPLTYLWEGDETVFATQCLEITEVEYYDKFGNSVERPETTGVYTVKALSFTLYDGASAERPAESGAGTEFRNYIIICENGELTVTKRSVTVTVNDNGWTYGDAPATINGYTVNLKDGLPYGEEFVLSYEYEPENPVNVGSYSIKGTVTGVKDGKGVLIENGLDNYEIEYVDGEINITPAAITVKTGSLTNGVYNGGYHYTTEGSLSDGTLYYGAQLVADGDNIFKVINATAATGVDNTTLFKIVDGEGKDVSKNYNISYKYGKIVVNPAAVTVSLVTGVEDVYGNLGYAEKLTLNAVSGAVNGEKVNLALGYTFNGAPVASPKNSGDYTANVNWNLSTVTRSDNTAGKISNYKLTATPAAATFKITQKEVTVTLNTNVESVYGEDYYGKLTENAVSGTVGTEKISLALNYTDNNGNAVVKPANAGVYTAEIDWNNCTVTGGLLSNYKLSAASAGADFEITPKSLNFAMKDLKVKHGEKIE